MAEAKNSFLASKMNKDLDDRLKPSNEYKDALNVSVSNSEDSDVGALENILQNTNVFPISATSSLGYNDGKVIGYAVDDSEDNIYLFWTNYIYDPAIGREDNQAASGNESTSSAIIQYNTKNNDFTKTLVSGRFLNFSTEYPVRGANIVESLLFWTDNRNQPRKINLKTAETNSSYYTNEDHISVAKYAPYKPIDLYKNYPGTGYKTTMKDVVSEYLPDGSTVNPDWNVDYAGDPNYLQDKFVRFSYRFHFDDGEYSIIAPFTQIAFIPKQDGSFIDRYDADGNLISSDEELTYQSTIVSFMENKVNQISLVINLPDTGNDLENNYKIKGIDILYKESDKIAISVLDTIDIAEIKNKALTTSVYEYSYQSRKPIKTLPQTQATRVYDKTPVKAFAQEVSGNRIIYGNYVNKHTAPNHLKYQIAATQKSSSGTDGNYSYIEYPEHTLKRNRNYQVGFVLSDRYGRQSDVVLSDVGSNNSSSSVFGASTFYFPYKKSNDTATVLSSIGSSIKIKLDEEISSTRSSFSSGSPLATGEPGLYNSLTNPTGWYSYKIVVKQTQQEYYNVYLPGFLKGDLGSGSETITHAVLASDNINKVPRDLQEVGPVQTKYSSDEILFPIVENYAPPSAGANWNQQFFPGNKKYEVTTVASFNDLANLGGSSGGSAELFESQEDPLIMRIGDNEEGLGSVNTHMLPTLSIAETTPFVSNLDIYYETSTSGLISDLNESIRSGQGSPIDGFSSFNYVHRENQNPAGGGNTTGASDSDWVSDDFIATNSSVGNINNSNLDSFSVVDKIGRDRTSDFTCTSSLINGAQNYRIKINTDFYYGADGPTGESYVFSIGLSNSDDSVLSGITNTSAVSNSVTIPLNSTTGVFITQIVSGTGIPPNSTVTGVGSNNITISASATIANNTTIQFTAPTSIVPITGVLQNITPILNASVYSPATTPAHTFPNYWQNSNSYFQPTVFNGAFDATKKLQGMTYVWETSQAGFLSGGGNVSFYTQGAKRFIVLGYGSSDNFSLSLDDTGKVELVSPRTINITEDFVVNFSATDAGGASTSVPVSFTYVEPGVLVNLYRDSYTTKSAACSGGGAGVNPDAVYMLQSDYDNNFINPGIQSTIQLYTNANRTSNYAPPGGAQYFYYENNLGEEFSFEVDANGVLQQSSVFGIICS
jgi:hypothetical protein